MPPIEFPVVPRFGRSTGPRLKGAASRWKCSNGFNTWAPGVFARCGDGTCDCCPYGYHIDLDFVRFCDSLRDSGHYQSYLEHLQLLKKDKRDRRKSLEEVMACPDLIFTGKKSRPPIPFSWLCNDESRDEDRDSLKDVIQDFEDTLHSSKTPLTLEERLPPDGGNIDLTPQKICEEQKRHVYTKEEQLKAEQLLDMIFGEDKLDARSRSSSVSSSESMDTISSLTYPSSNSSLSRQLELTMASLTSGECVNLYDRHTVTIDKTVLSKIRDQLAACLEKMRRLELQAKDIPILQVKMSVLKEEKRLLKLQLKAKNQQNRSEHSTVTGSLSSLAYESSIGESHPSADESLRQKRIPLLAIKTPPPPPPRVPPLHPKDLPQANIVPKLQRPQLRIEEESYSSTRPSKLEALKTPSHSSLARSKRSLDERVPPLHGEKSVEEELTASSLSDQIWDETTQTSRGESSDNSSSRIAKYLKEATVNEEVVIPRHMQHTGINCCAETRERGTHTDRVETRHAGVGSVSPLPAPIKDTPPKKTLCDSCQMSLHAPQRKPRTSSTQTDLRREEKVVPDECKDCVQRNKRSLKTSSVNTDPLDEPPRKAPKESLTFDVCEGTSFTPKRHPCEDCEKRKKVRTWSVGSATDRVNTKEQGSDAQLEEASTLPKKLPPTPPPKPKIFTRTTSTQSTSILSQSQGVQVSPERLRTKDCWVQCENSVSARNVGVQYDRMRMSTNSVASGEFDVRHSVCDSCSNKRLRSVGTGESTLYDDCCNRCSASNKRDGQIQCEIITIESLYKVDEPKMMVDQFVLTDDPYCEDITELIAIPCERCDVEKRSFGFGDDDVFAELPEQLSKPPTDEVGVMTDHSIIEPLNLPPMPVALSRTSSASSMSQVTGGVRLCDKCNCTIETVAKDFIDKNIFDPVLPTIQSKIPKLSQRSPRAPPRRAKPAAFESVSRSLRHAGGGGGLGEVLMSKEDLPIVTVGQSLPEPAERSGEKHTLPKEMELACTILNEYLQKPEKSDPNKLKNAVSVVQADWFKITSPANADVHQVEDFMEEFEKLSNHLLHRIINMADVNGNTALHYAVSHGNFAVVSKLLDSKVTDVNKQNRAGYTPVMLVALAQIDNDSHKVVVQRLFNMGDVNAKASQNGQTALMLAASHGRGDTVKMLLDSGADPNTQDNDGSTALMCAAEHGYIELVRLLLANPDVEINIADNDGSTALSIAMEAGHKDTALLVYASSNFSRGSSPYSSLRGRKSRISPRATPPPSRPSRTPPPSRPARTPPPPSPSRSRKGSTSSVSSFSRAWF